MKLRVGIAGYGVVGKRRREVIDMHAHLATYAVCDQVFDGSGSFDDGVKFFPHYSQLILEPLDILFVCLPNYLAAEVTKAGLERGMHVFCEKPPGRNLADIISVIEVESRHSHQKLKYGFNHRYHESVQEAIKLVASQDLGRVINLRGVYGKSKLISFGQDSDWRTKRELSGGGILLDQGIHMVDLMRLFGGEFLEVKSFISNDFWNHDVEDNAYALLKSESGTIAMLHSTATQWRHRFDLDICCERGNINLGGILSGSKSYGAETLTISWAEDFGIGDPREQRTLYNRDPSWKAEIDEFAKCVLENVAVLHGTSQDALRTMELVYRIYCADPLWKKKWGLSDSAEPSAQRRAANII